MTKVLFVCLGNICRSPAANGIFNALINKNHLSGSIACDSCGTGNWHIGCLPDKRMREAGARHGYAFDHRARQFDPENDFKDFDLILTMDNENLRDVRALAGTAQDLAKIKLFTNFCNGDYANTLIVEDPYFSEKPDAFDAVIAHVENGCEGLLKFLTEKQA
ncbi:MAG: low molecular weight phosphotyrosine protein phosphatase [Opitutales bacterium]|nr:low molecular weight phosphotyrosine protein phosphatase [Opitutales bacterium]